MSLDRTVQIHATAPKQCHQFTALQNTPISASKATLSVLCSLASESNNIQTRDVIRSHVRRDVNIDQNSRNPIIVNAELHGMIHIRYPARCYFPCNTAEPQRMPSVRHYTGRFIKYSGITKIYYRRTVGHVFTKPVQIEGTIKKKS